MIYKVLNNGGFLLIAVRDGIGKNSKSSYTSIDGEDYDRNFYLHTLEELKKYSSRKYDFVKEIVIDNKSSWKYYIFERIDYEKA